MTATSVKLPNQSDALFLTDGGMETDLLFNHGFELPEFASFVLLEDDAGRAAIRKYYEQHAALAAEHGTGFVFESATWRASPEWGEKLGYSLDRLAAVNRDAVELIVEMRAETSTDSESLLISGAIGPRGDGYNPAELQTPEEAQAYHAWQVGVLAEAGVDLVTVFTLTHPGEAIGLVRAAQEARVPIVISFTLETDGKLPDGTPLGTAIEMVDAATDSGAAYFMINCAHPTHFSSALEADAAWMQRLRGIRANASRMSHAQLDESELLDDGDPAELGEQYAELREAYPQFTVLGGCCGTDSRHVASIAEACVRT